MSAIEMVKGAYEAFGRGDVPAVLAVLDPEIEWREAEGHPYQPSGEAWVGTEAVLMNLFAKLAGEWDGFTIHPARFHDAGDVVVMEGRYSGTFKETGRDIDAQACHIWTVRDGKLAKFQQYLDTAQLREVMGASAAG